MNRYGIAALLLALGFGIAWYSRAPDIPAGVTVDATPARELKREETVPLIVTFPLQVYAPKVKAKLKLPAAVIADTSTHVVAATKTPNDERQHTITTTIDSNTGEFASYDRVDPLPWVAVNTKTQVGLFYGLRGREQIIRLQGQQELLQIKAVHLGAVVSADIGAGDVDTFIGVGAWARW